MSKHYISYDQNIVKALKELKLPMLNFKNEPIYFQKRKRYEDTFEHIANKEHHLKLKDVKIIEKIIKDKNSITKDKKAKRGICYIGKRTGIEKQRPYLKIVCIKNKNNIQEISNIYPIKKKVNC